ncbi:hypothetical protein BDN70DRAFT_897162 [Pholiota conissans]|uniref:Beta-lactamase-related domain-containing protein n=1 Tax=Pholiota conissans TaxID=109636 RepID=A0A9P5YZC8_9AGAR|nr:hypothetical protein BDN70DRAFT_897162 [Pholiota conissans]
MVVLIEEGRVALNSLLAQAIAENRVPGAYFAAATADRMLYSGSAGLRSFRDPTSGKVAIIQLIGASKITFETPVDSIVPELANPVVVDDINALEYTFRPAQNKILIKRLLNHSSGLHYVPICRKASPESLGPAYTEVGYGGDFFFVAEILRTYTGTSVKNSRLCMGRRWRLPTTPRWSSYGDSWNLRCMQD